MDPVAAGGEGQEGGGDLGVVPDGVAGDAGADGVRGVVVEVGGAHEEGVGVLEEGGEGGRWRCGLLGWRCWRELWSCKLGWELETGGECRAERGRDSGIGTRVWRCGDWVAWNRC